MDRDGRVVRAGSVDLPAEAIAGANGAGDAFNGGLLFGLHEGWEPARCLALANAAAACSMTSLSTWAGGRPWTEALAFAETHGRRR